MRENNIVSLTRIQTTRRAADHLARSAMAPRSGKTPATAPRRRAKQYRQIAGVRYDESALVIADEAVLSHGKISLADARAMFADVEDGPGVTETEYATLRFVAEGGRDGKEYHLDPSASKYLVGKLREHDPATRVRPARSPRLYRTVRGVRYDENALTIAEAAVKHRGRVSKEDAEAIWADVHDHGEVTDTEYRTLARVCGGGFKITAAAKRFLWDKVPPRVRKEAEARRMLRDDDEEDTDVEEVEAETPAPAKTAKRARATTSKKRPRRADEDDTGAGMEKDTRDDDARGADDPAPTPRTTRKRAARDADAAPTAETAKRTKTRRRATEEDREGVRGGGDVGGVGDVGGGGVEDADAAAASARTAAAAIDAAAVAIDAAVAVSPRAAATAAATVSPPGPRPLPSPPATGASGRVRFATSDPDAELSPTGGSPSPSRVGAGASPNTWLRRRDNSVAPASPPHTHTGATATVAARWHRRGAAELPRERRGGDSVRLRRAGLAGAVMDLFTTPVSLPDAAAAVGGGYLAALLLKAVFGVAFVRAGGETWGSGGAGDWATLADRWSAVEAAVGRLGAAVAANAR